MSRRSPGLALAALTLPVLLISIDMTVLGTALPALAEDLDPGAAEQLWIVDAYSFVLAGLLVTMGTLGDRIGRRRLLLWGSAAFGLASVAAAFAPSAGALVAARALLGLGGATLMPSTFSLIKTTFPEPRRRAVAVAVWSAAFSGGAAAGPVLAGFLLEHFWWGSVFLVNVPVIVLLLVAGPVVLPESRDPHPGPFDLVSAVLSLAAMVPVVAAVKTVATEGPTPTAALAAALGLGAGALFVHRQRTVAHPLLDLRLFTRRSFSVSVVTNLLGVFALVGLLLLLPQYLQLVLGLGPLSAALWMLPGSAAGVAGALVAARLTRRLAPPALVGLGLAGAGLGLALVAAFGGLAGVVVGFALLGGGVALAEALTNDLILAAAPTDRAGAASAISETGYELGGALGTAVIGSLAAAVFTARTGQETLGGAITHAAGLDPAAGSALAVAARDAFTAGLQGAAALGAVVLVLTAVGAWRQLRAGAADDREPVAV
ncbi:MFS transporter [Actinomycetospora sp. NBRC 106375]|uniref:MFS transporter n=1 Tax=Actinomycetospora sp. NBRC 106375 TaxID=3032207 RepID=UPI00249FD6E0|nr:MFS transporter [Actinomycetospora sp. NBRC 106375]GLZ45515.1 MFS transporter [Actinomycetospora sp. NBRC 106375]